MKKAVPVPNFGDGTAFLCLSNNRILYDCDGIGNARNHTVAGIVRFVKLLLDFFIRCARKRDRIIYSIHSKVV